MPAAKITNVWPSLINTVPVPGPTPATGTLAGFVVPSNYNFALTRRRPWAVFSRTIKKIPTQNSPSLKNFAPRVGFAWKPLASDRFVVRGGAGYFYDRVGWLNTFNVHRQRFRTPFVSQSGAANYFSTLAQPYAPTSLGWSPRWVNINTTNTATQTGTSSNLNVHFFDPNSTHQLTYEWNLNIQYEFLPQWVLEVGYVGTRGIHQAFTVPALDTPDQQAQLASPANPINGITTNTVANASLRVPYWAFRRVVSAMPNTLETVNTTACRQPYASSSPTGSNCRQHTRSAAPLHTGSTLLSRTPSPTSSTIWTGPYISSPTLYHQLQLGSAFRQP